MERAWVTVIVPCYNHEAFVEQTVRSVWAQKHQRLDLVVLDDGSRDRSAEVLRRLQRESPIPFQLVVKENEGICKTLNRGLALARGEFVSLIASDDWMEPDKLLRQVPVLQQLPESVALVYSNAHIVDGQGQRTGQSLLKPGRAMPSGRVLRRLLLQGPFLAALTCLYRKSALEAVGGFDEELVVDDYDMFIRLAERFEFHHLDFHSTNYRRHGGNMTATQHRRIVEDAGRLYSKLQRSSLRPRDLALFAAQYADLLVDSGQLGDVGSVLRGVAPLQWPTVVGGVTYRRLRRLRGVLARLRASATGENG